MRYDFIRRNSTVSSDAAVRFCRRYQPDLDELSKSDMECLDLSFSKYKDLDMGELSDVSHDTAWSKAWIKRQNCSIDYLDMAEAGGASEDLIEYIRESDEFAFYLQ